MKVSMIPDNSVKMIHASQDDVGRRWEFELYDEDSLIDVSSVEEQMIYPVYQGGTEQILPENTSTPTTSPIVADIVYPDELREEQEFLYRECPSAEDGNARIKKIVGNTVKWNQLCKNGNFSDGTTRWSTYSDTYISISASSGVLRADYITSTTSGYQGGVQYTDSSTSQNVFRHKFIIAFDIKTSFDTTILIEPFVNTSSTTDQIRVQANTKTRIIAYSNIVGAAESAKRTRVLIYPATNQGVGDYYEISNFNIFDLTLNGLDSLTSAQAKQWYADYYNLPYYAYNPGTLIPFTGTQIKTMNADQTVESIVNLPTTTYFPDGMKNTDSSLYDELSTNNAIKRINQKTFDGSENWELVTNYGYIITVNNSGIRDCIRTTSANTSCLSNLFERSGITWLDGHFGIENQAIWVADRNLARFGSLENFKTYLSTHPLTIYYQLAEPVETPIASASLVSQNQEIPMVVEDDKLVAYSTSEITEQSGFHDAKIKLSNDGVAYSAKFTMHIERKP